MPRSLATLYMRAGLSVADCSACHGARPNFTCARRLRCSAVATLSSGESVPASIVPPPSWMRLKVSSSFCRLSRLTACGVVTAAFRLAIRAA